MGGNEYADGVVTGVCLAIMAYALLVAVTKVSGAPAGGAGPGLPLASQIQPELGQGGWAVVKVVMAERGIEEQLVDLFADREAAQALMDELQGYQLAFVDYYLTENDPALARKLKKQEAKR